jgi:hypothetical protein
MRRDRLDAELDLVFTKRLTSLPFLRARLKSLKQETKGVDRERLNTQIESLSARRQRILDSYFEGVINPTERDTRLAEIERERKIASDLLARQSPKAFDVDRIAMAFRAFVAFDELKREQKRRLLSTIRPEVIVKDYLIDGIRFGICESRTATGYAGNERIWLPLGIAA